MTDRITRHQIVSVGVSLLGRGGLHALAMRAIASELGVQQSALYWHFDNKQQLLGAIADRVVGPVAVPSGGSWRARLEALATRLRRAVLAYPDGAELVATAFAFRLGAHRAYRQFSGELVSAGLPRDDADTAASVLWHFVLGYATDEQQHRQAAKLGAIEPAPDHAAVSSDRRFANAIDLILTGIAARPPLHTRPGG